MGVICEFEVLTKVYDFLYFFVLVMLTAIEL